VAESIEYNVGVKWLVGWLIGIHFTSVDGDQVHHLASRRAYTTCLAMELQCCYTTLESISCLRGYCYHFRTAAPLPVEETERDMYIRVVSLHSEA
jgi:hypothetical protein